MKPIKLADVTNKEKSDIAEYLERLGLFDSHWAEVALGVKEGNQLEVFKDIQGKYLNDDKYKYVIDKDIKTLVVLNELVETNLANIWKLKNED